MRSIAWEGDWRLTQGFGENAHIYGPRFGLWGGHNGVDLGMPTGTLLQTPQAGTVTTAAFDAGGYGNFVRVRADDGGEWLLAHLSQFDVSLGQRVGPQEPLGRSGNTGNSTGPHLHLGYRRPGWEGRRGNGFDGFENPLSSLQSSLEPRPINPVSPEERRILDVIRGLQANADSIVTWINEIGALRQANAEIEEKLRLAVAAGGAPRRVSRVTVFFADGAPPQVTVAPGTQGEQRELHELRELRERSSPFGR